MKLSLLQPDIVWGNPQANQEKLSEILWGLEPSDLYVLPEMFSTGFAVEPQGIAETDASSLVWMQKMAQELKGALCGSVAVEEEGRYYNRLYFVKPNGDCFAYDKHHLFTYADEHRHYTRGNEKVVVEFRGVRFLLQVCYDLRFPCFSRNTDKIPYDCAIYVASWPTTRLSVWNTLLHARAIENQCYVAGVNRTGSDDSGRYSGGTMLVDPYGNTAAACPLEEATAITVQLDLPALKVFRKKFPVLKDAD
ncbi:MAG: amidohydrolase [Bacteroidaceae bacterium]|nr:amidohydrolase [Bacteroidaceae bacterium]